VADRYTVVIDTDSTSQYAKALVWDSESQTLMDIPISEVLAHSVAASFNTGFMHPTDYPWVLR